MQQNTDIIIPPYLQPGSVVGITCPSGYVSEERVAYAVEVLGRWGFRVKMGKTVGSEHHYFSGTDEERLADLQGMLNDPEVDAIIMGRGGYGMSRIIDDLDFTAFIAKPKWVTGFSDLTILHNHIERNYGIATLHSAMCGAFKPETETAEYILSFKHALTGAPLAYTMQPSVYNRAGVAEAEMVGGNLAIMAHLTGSVSALETDGKILFIEDIGEYLYNADRLLLNLKRAGKLDRLKGLVVGSFTLMQDTDRPFGQTIEQIIADKVREYDYPVCFNFDCGHQDVNYTFVHGGHHKLVVNDAGGTLELIRPITA